MRRCVQSLIAGQGWGNVSQGSQICAASPSYSPGLITRRVMTTALPAVVRDTFRPQIFPPILIRVPVEVCSFPYSIQAPNTLNSLSVHCSAPNPRPEMQSLLPSFHPVGISQHSGIKPMNPQNPMRPQPDDVSTAQRLLTASLHREEKSIRSAGPNEMNEGGYDTVTTCINVAWEITKEGLAWLKQQ